MKLKFIEATNGLNFGKFAVGRYTLEEWNYQSVIDQGKRLIARCGWEARHVFVLDLQTGEGAMFFPGGMASSDLRKHRIWVCPLYEPFLTWLYTQDLSHLDRLPSMVELPDAPAALAGYRRPGPG